MAVGPARVLCTGAIKLTCDRALDNPSSQPQRTRRRHRSSDAAYSPTWPYGAQKGGAKANGDVSPPPGFFGLLASEILAPTKRPLSTVGASPGPCRWDFAGGLCTGQDRASDCRGHTKHWVTKGFITSLKKVARDRLNRLRISLWF